MIAPVFSRSTMTNSWISSSKASFEEDVPPISKIGDSAFLIPKRIEQTELLDQGAGSLADVRANLDEMWKVSQVFGGIDLLTRYIKTPFQRESQPMRIVDLGTGSGKLALHLVRNWAHKHHIQVCVYPLDLSRRNLYIAHENTKSEGDIHLVQANGLALPFAADCIDYFVSSLFLHHFSPDSLIELLGAIYKLTRRGIIMSDITRGILPMVAFRLIQPFFARHFLTRHDGILSIKRAYCPEELLHMAQAAGIRNARVYTHFPWRMTLVADKHV